MNNVVHYPFNNVVQHLWSNNCCSALLNEDRTRIDRTRLFAIVIIVAQPCRQVVTVLMVKQGCNDVIVLDERTTLLTTLFTGGAQHCSGLFTTSNMLCVYMRLLCVYARVDGASLQEGNLQGHAACISPPSSGLPPTGTKAIQSKPGLTVEVVSRWFRQQWAVEFG